jgi:hypothetical protein
MILGKKRVKNKNDYMRIYGVGIGYGKGVSQSNHARPNLRRGNRNNSRKLPIGSKLAPINMEESRNKRNNAVSLEYSRGRKGSRLAGSSLVNKLRKERSHLGP